MANASLDDCDQDGHQHSTYRRIELITGETQRRRRTVAEKARILADSFHPGAKVSEVALRHGVNRGLLWTWRRQARKHVADGQSAFVPVRMWARPLLGRSPPRQSCMKVPRWRHLRGQKRPEGSRQLAVSTSRSAVRAWVSAAPLMRQSCGRSSPISGAGHDYRPSGAAWAAHPGDRPAGRFSPRHGQPVHTGEGDTGSRSIRRRCFRLPRETRPTHNILHMVCGWQGR
jgi:transposase-like protein